MDDGGGRGGLSFLGGPLPVSFERRVVVVAPGRERLVDAADWQDALVVVERGGIELETAAGARSRFGCGDVLCLVGLPVRSLRNRGREPAVLAAVSRSVIDTASTD
jgi:hypothetical protein